MFATTIRAQQIPLYSNYAFNTFGHNPAFAGNKNRIEGILTHRQHLNGFPGAPTTQLFTASMPIQKYYLGTGIKIVNDIIGITRNTSFSAAANYYMGLGGGRLAAGLEIGGQQYAVNWDELDLLDPDNTIPQSKQSVLVGNGAFGLFYSMESWYAGYSIQNLFRSKLDFDKEESPTEARLYFHHYIQAGMAIGLNDNFALEPHTLIKITKSAPMQMDIGLYTVFKQMVGAGISYRTGDAMYVTAKYEWKEMISVGYNYGIRLNSLSQYTSNSHEFMVSYFYKLMEPASKEIKHPYWFIN
jgi:type IX secretion system PorP/SprF family membrane protein